MILPRQRAVACLPLVRRMTALRIVARIFGLFLLIGGLFAAAVGLLCILIPSAARWPMMLILSALRRACLVPF